MKLHEYQAKEVLAPYGVPIQRGVVAETVEEAVAAAQAMAAEGVALWVVKAQIHAGGRGKGGGVKLARSVEEVREKADAILGMQLVTPQTGEEGQTVRKILVAAAEDIAHEYYLGVLLDRALGLNVVMASAAGGMDIEKVAEETPDHIVRVHVDPAAKLVESVYRAYEGADASLVEINPMALLEDGRVVALDAKVTLDDNALFRHVDLAALRDVNEEDPLEVEASEHSLNYVKLDGNVGCMVNGAGLAMATMDIIKLAGGDPANFLDVGGGANPTTVEAGFRIILKDPNVRAILVNIFGGIVRCDRVALGIVEAARNVEITVPLIVRLQGTNAEEGMTILRESGVELQAAIGLQEAADKVRAVVGQ